MRPKGAKGTPEVSPKSTKIPQKIATSKKVEKGGAQQHLLGFFLTYFSSKMRPKIDANKYAEKHVKKLEN